MQTELNFDGEDPIVESDGAKPKNPKEEPEMSSGQIVQIIGAVIDVEFPRDAVPKVYDALTVTEKRFDSGSSTTIGRRYCSHDCDGFFRRC